MPMPFELFGFFILMQIPIIWFLRKKLISTTGKRKYFENKFFVIPLALILASYSLQGIGYYMQENMFSNAGEWHRALIVSDSALCLIIACLIVRIVFAIKNKLNLMEYIAIFSLNLVSLFIVFILIFSRI